MNPPLGVWCIGGTSNQAEADFIRARGYRAWAQEFVEPAVARVRQLGRDPIVVLRFPGAGFGSWAVTLADCYRGLVETDFAEMVRHLQLPRVSIGKQTRQTPAVVRLYLPSPEAGDAQDLANMLNVCVACRCGAYWEDVKNSARRTTIRMAGRFTFTGCEPFWDRGSPEMVDLEPCIVDEQLLDKLGADYTGKSWPSNWVPLAAGQRRTLIMRPDLASMANVVMREAAGWSVAVWSHRVAALSPE